jgi:hypothetical protein
LGDDLPDQQDSDVDDGSVPCGREGHVDVAPSDIVRSGDGYFDINRGSSVSMKPRPSKTNPMSAATRAAARAPGLSPVQSSPSELASVSGNAPSPSGLVKADDGYFDINGVDRRTDIAAMVAAAECSGLGLTLTQTPMSRR